MDAPLPEVLPALLTVRDVARILKLHQSTIYRMLDRGQLPGWRLGSDWRFNPEDIDAWVATQPQGQVKVKV